MILDITTWRRVRARNERECRLMMPVVEAINALHGHSTGSGDALPVASYLAEWLAWRIDEGWTLELTGNANRRAFDRCVRNLAAAAIAEFEAR